MPVHLIDCLVDAARRAASADNMQPWQFSWDGTTLRVLFVRRGDPGVAFGIDNPASLLAFGGVIENLAQMAQALGTALLEPATFPGDEPDCVLRCRVASPMAPAPPDWHAHPLFARHTNRLPYAATAVAPEVIARIAALSCGQAGCTLYSLPADAPELARWSALLRSASQLRFRNRAAHMALDASLRMNDADAARGDGLDVQTLYLPPGGRALLAGIRSWPRMRWLNGFGLYRLLAGIESGLLAKGPGLLLLTGAPGQQGGLDAGRLLTRAWTLLNQLGLAVQPFYAIPDQLARLDDGSATPALLPLVRQLRQHTERALPDGATLYMLLRVGYPLHVPRRSQRLPVGQLLQAPGTGAGTGSVPGPVPGPE